MGDRALRFFLLSRKRPRQAPRQHGRPQSRVRLLPLRDASRAPLARDARYARIANDATPSMLTRTSPRERSLASLASHGFHRVVWHEWGAADNPRVVVCVHGLTRTGRDFDVLGEALAPTHRVLAVDMPGRGRSEWLPAKTDYVYSTYLTVLVALVA